MAGVNDVVLVPCKGCKMIIRAPGGRVRSALRRGMDYVVFCSKKCNTKHVAENGVRAQEEKLRARHSDSHAPR